ncbi:MAG TPA: DUF445 domain-containing protein [Paenibacillaceae bacterium]|nr:DUF445 domain-containing protein [Paenibacillaceae bacterium]
MAGKAKHIAGISLAIMGAGFISTLPFQDTTWGRIFQAGFEAGLVGGLADWFAVTALFRHPLGIPIPHTALLPKNRERVTQALINTLEKDWLNKESIEREISSICISCKLIELAEKELASEDFPNTLRRIWKEMIEHIDIEKLAAYLEQEIKDYVHRADIKPYIPRLADEVIQKEYDGIALDYTLEKVAQWAIKRENRNRLGKIALDLLDRVEVEGFMGFALRSFTGFADGDKVGKMIQEMILNVTSQLREQDNSLRLQILVALRNRILNIAEEPGLLNEVDSIKAKLIDDWKGKEHISLIIQQLLEKAKEYTGPFLQNLLGKLKEDKKKQGELENWIQQRIFKMIEKNHYKIGQLVKKNLDKLDHETLITMMEDKIGKDLQWIRVNGSLCGFLIGLGLVGIKLLLQ